jgi:catechol 2,3-dioxygenase-like lactoylglutathione lyase family enzyme
VALSGIQVVSVPVADQERALAFYRDTLGFEVKTDAEFGAEMRWLELEPPGGGPSITLVTWFDDMPPGSLQGVVLGTDDIVADHDRLTERGIEFTGPPAAQPWGTFASFNDPDGNSWVLVQTA